MVYGCFYSRPILKISQPRGLRDPRCGCSFEPLVLTVPPCPLGTEAKGAGEPDMAEGNVRLFDVLPKS